ncbi:hypothetical protein [Caballeronia sp. dw_19]|uniref:hypothetical protein n=1 Tax=Caballeronia sp. dw_19 TaxID=2719791 RepID=UPI001BD0AA30|nr:hypothetical protein [Caballeronia sp. dw_19]
MTTPSPISDQAAGELPGWRKPPENEHPYAKKMREAHEKKYGNLAGVVDAFNIYRNVIERFRRPYNGEMSDCVTNADLDAAEQEMLSNVREEIRWISTAPTTGSAPVANTDEWHAGYTAGYIAAEKDAAPASPAANVLTDDQRCAARYRLIRAGFGDFGPEADLHNAFVDGGEKLDVALDALLASSMGGDPK